MSLCDLLALWRENISSLLRAKREAQGIFLCGVVLPLISAAWLFWRLQPSGEGEIFIPLHYNVFTGIDRYGPWWLGFTIPMVGLAITCVHVLVTRTFLQEKTAQTMFYAFLFGTLPLQIGLVFAAIFLGLLNS
jgi:hypothetical protein